jgi:thiosulfate/3-mercaptopyruvate sulfurtransferase
MLMEADTLKALLGTPALVLVDVDDRERYLERHIPGARHLDFALLIRQQPPAMGLLPDTPHLLRVMAGLGIGQGSRVVAYDGSGGGKASRLLWTLACLGLDGELLNGGLQAWAAAGHTLQRGAEQSLPADPTAAALTPPPSPASEADAHIDSDAVLARLGNPEVTVLDARSPAEYAGIDRRAARSGHIPGAINLDWTELRDPTRCGRLLPDSALRALLSSRGIDPEPRDREIIVHCQTHHRSALLWVALRHLGYTRVRGYAGSWSEWGNDPRLPVQF